ncbi:beta-ketoacyl synthase [Nemania diffusa]|nr:beta-ketoacyl synthase [Nemania diffusa]
MDFDLGSASDRSVSVSSQNTYSLASGSSNAPASGRRAKQDAADAKRVLRTIKQVKENTYKVKKGGPSGKYLIQRTLHHSGYKLLQKELNKPENRDLLEPLAIVGLFLKFPQDATSPDEFWKMILEKRCAMTEFPSDRFNIDAFYGLDNSRADTITPRGGHFVKEDLYLFDAPFFSITSVEAASMDVQQRQLQECVNRALENTGMPLESVSGSKTSVDTGSFADDYKLMTMRDHEMMPKYAATGSLISILAKTLLQNLSEIFRTTAIG